MIQLARRFFITLLIGATFFYYLFAVFVAKTGDSFEGLADLLLISGGILIAGGATVSDKKRQTMLAIVKQEQEMIVTKIELLKMKIFLARKLEAPDWKLEELEYQLEKISDNKYFTQSHLAKIFIETSDKTSAGTILLTMGTIILLAKVTIRIFGIGE